MANNQLRILHYCSNCKKTAIAGQKDDVLYCTYCNVGQTIEDIYSDNDDISLEDVFDDVSIDYGDSAKSSLADLLKEV